MAGTVRLGRAWDERVGPPTNYVNGVSPNGQAVIRQSLLAGHVRTDAPWGPSMISRPAALRPQVISTSDPLPGSSLGKIWVARGSRAEVDLGEDVDDAVFGDRVGPGDPDAVTG